MALLHSAQLQPSKLELLTTWLPSCPWADVSSADLELVAFYRFDDPAGAVGIETLLVRAGDGPVLQVPLTYRDAPDETLAPWFIATMEHSALGRRWAYDGCGDPVYVAALLRAIVTGGREAELMIEVDGRLEAAIRPNAATVIGNGGLAVDAVPTLGGLRVDNGDPTVITSAGVTLTVARRIDATAPAAGLALLGEWPGTHTPDSPVVLATAALPAS